MMKKKKGKKRTEKKGKRNRERKKRHLAASSLFAFVGNIFSVTTFFSLFLDIRKFSFFKRKSI